jgi:hypothetical protein
MHHFYITRENIMKKILYLAILASVLVVAASENSYAIPAFARKYNTSCATCHVGFPKLNAFGEAFRRNGYQFPGHTDAEFIKQDQVSLGAEGNLFPMQSGREKFLGIRRSLFF